MHTQHPQDPQPMPRAPPGPGCQGPPPPPRLQRPHCGRSCRPARPPSRRPLWQVTPYHQMCTMDLSGVAHVPQWTSVEWRMCSRCSPRRRLRRPGRLARWKWRTYSRCSLSVEQETPVCSPADPPRWPVLPTIHSERQVLSRGFRVRNQQGRLHDIAVVLDLSVGLFYRRAGSE
jgi:hypothetical protein